MFTQFMKEKSFAGCNPTCKETGFALLGTVFVAALVMGIGALGILAMTKSASTSVYGENAANQARTAALMGINALTQYAEQEYTSNGMNGVSGVPVGTAIVKSMGANDKAPLSNVQAAVIANTYYNPPVVSLNLLGIVTNVLPQPPNQNGAIFVQSTGRAGPYAETARAMLTLQQNNANGAFVPTPYDIFARVSATFNGGATTGANTTIGAGSAAIYGGSTIGNLNAGSVSINGSTTFSSISAANSFSSNGNNQGTVQLGNQVIGGLPASRNGLIYQLLSANATSQLEQNIEQAPIINATGLETYAGLEFLDSGDGNENGNITVTSSEAAILDENLQPSATLITGGTYYLQPSTTTGTQELDSLETAICGNDTCLSYSGGIDGTWSINGGISSSLAAFIYVEGGLTVNGNSGSASNPVYLTIAANNAVTFNGGAYLKPYATLPDLCITQADNPVCSGGSPNLGVIGLSIVSGSTSGEAYEGSGITFDGNSGIYGSIASNGSITINGSSTLYGRVVTNNSLTMNGKVGALVQGAGNANFGGGSPATANPPIVAIRWLRWM